MLEQIGLTDKWDREAFQLCIISFDELDVAKEKFFIPQRVYEECREERNCKFESHNGFDFIVLCPSSGCGPKARVCIYFCRSLLLFICDSREIAERVSREIQTETEESLSLEQILFHFFDRLTKDDIRKLQQMESEISRLEEFLITGKEINYIREIIEMRKRLMVLKRYYEQLSDIAEDICENETELIREKTMKFLRIFQSRVERLYQEVLNLRDYITQVREAYQAQVDINLNNIMKLFTVITAIFLPLTLIVGWYGMNLQMPEYGWRFGYPVIIGISAAVVAGVIIYFKRKKWF